MQYRIIRNNKCSIGYQYFIQKKYFGLIWLNVSDWDQAYNRFSLSETKEKLHLIIEKHNEFVKRKLTKNNEIIMVAK